MSFIKNLLTLPFRKFKEFQKDLFSKSNALDDQIGKMRTDVKRVMKERKDAETAAENQGKDVTNELTKYVDSYVNEANEIVSAQIHNLFFLFFIYNLKLSESCAMIFVI